MTKPTNNQEDQLQQAQEQKHRGISGEKEIAKALRAGTEKDVSGTDRLMESGLANKLRNALEKDKEIQQPLSTGIDTRLLRKALEEDKKVQHLIPSITRIYGNSDSEAAQNGATKLSSEKPKQTSR
jgi:hypothetical protein